MPQNSSERLDAVNDGLSLLQNKNHLLFGTDALLLAGYLGKGGRAAELGAGSGAVSLLAASRDKFREIVGYELQESAADLFARNITLNGFDDRVRAVCADVRFLPSSLAGSFDCVFSNPPYMKADAGFACRSDEKQIARHETAGGIDDFCAAAALLLRFGGEAVFVYRPDRLCDLFTALRNHGLEPKRATAVCADPLHAPSMVLVCAKKGGAPQLYFTPVFFISREDGSPTEDYDALMKEGCFHERFLKP